MRITNLKKNLEYLIGVKSYGKLSVQFKAIFSNKMAENSNFRSPKLLIQFRYFKCFFSFEFLKVFLFKKNVIDHVKALKKKFRAKLMTSFYR